MRKDPIFHKNETKTEDRKFSHRSRFNYDCKEFIPGKKYFSDDLSQSSNHELDKNYKSDEEDYKMLCNLISTRYFFRGSLRISLFHRSIQGSGRKKDRGSERKTHQIS